MNNQHNNIAGLSTYIGKYGPLILESQALAKIVLVVLYSREEHLYVFIYYSNLPCITVCSSPNIVCNINLPSTFFTQKSSQHRFWQGCFDKWFYARISKIDCLNKTQTFTIINMLYISYKHIPWSISFGFKICGPERKTGKQQIEVIVLHTLHSQTYNYICRFSKD